MLTYLQSIVRQIVTYSFMILKCIFRYASEPAIASKYMRLTVCSRYCDFVIDSIFVRSEVYRSSVRGYLFPYGYNLNAVFETVELTIHQNNLSRNVVI